MSQHGLTTPLLIILALGGIGLYLLLPRGRDAGHVLARWIGGLLSTIAAALLAQQLAAQIPHFTNGLAFYVMAAVSLIAAVLMISSHNPIHAALWFALVLLTNSGLYLLQGAEFLAAATIIIYAGAIIVTFLFVIMLAQPKGTALYDRYSREPFLACVAGLILSWTLLGTISFTLRQETRPLGERITAAGKTESNKLTTVLPTKAVIETTLHRRPHSIRIDPEVPHVVGLGRALFLDHYISVEVIGVILLVAVVGACLITAHPHHAPDPEPRQP